jgi:hypothetical protein
MNPDSKLAGLRHMLTTADWVVVAGALLFLPVLYSYYWPGSARAELVEIQVADQEPMHVPLHIDRRLAIQGELGTSEIQIRDHRVRFTRSPCEAKLCIASGWHEHAGETVACLPNRVSVSIVSSDSVYDAINY